MNTTSEKRKPGRKTVSDKKKPVIIYIKQSVIDRFGKDWIQLTATQTIEERDEQERLKDLNSIK